MNRYLWMRAVLAFGLGMATTRLPEPWDVIAGVSLISWLLIYGIFLRPPLTAPCYVCGRLAGPVATSGTFSRLRWMLMMPTRHEFLYACPAHMQMVVSLRTSSLMRSPE